MADKIQKPDPEVHGTAVTSVTTTVPSEADADSNRYADEINRPPVSTNEPQTPIAHSLVAGAGAPQPVDGPLPEDWEPDGNGGARVADDAPDREAQAAQATPSAESKKSDKS